MKKVEFGYTHKGWNIEDCRYYPIENCKKGFKVYKPGGKHWWWVAYLDMAKGHIDCREGKTATILGREV